MLWSVFATFFFPALAWLLSRRANGRKYTWKTARVRAAKTLLLVETCAAVNSGAHLSAMELVSSAVYDSSSSDGKPSGTDVLLLFLLAVAVNVVRNCCLSAPAATCALMTLVVPRLWCRCKSCPFGSHTWKRGPTSAR